MLTLGAVSVSAAALPARTAPAEAKSVRLPLVFEANQGQAPASVSFVAHGPRYTAYLAAGGARLRLSAQGRAAAVQVSLLGANRHAEASGLEPLRASSNYLVGSDPANWRTGIADFARVRFAEVYPGIDLLYYGKEGALEYDFLIRAGADPGQIRFRVSGAERLALDASGDLLIGLAGSELRFRKPIVYEELDGRRRPIAGGYLLGRNGQVSFQVGPHAPRASLVIDPVLLYLTYLNGSGAGEMSIAYGLATDSAGNIYLAGTTNSVDFPSTGGELQTTSGTINTSLGFVTKLDANGKLVYSTYFGGRADGTNGTQVNALAVDTQGNAYLTGATFSSSFPTTPGVLQRTLGSPGTTCANPPCSDAFVAKLNSSGSALVFSTFLGGKGNDYGRKIHLDSAGNIYIQGDLVASPDFPVSPGSFPALSNGGSFFVTKLDPAATKILASTFFDYVWAIHDMFVDQAGLVYLTGTALDPVKPLPTTAGAIQAKCTAGSASINLCSNDAFAVKLDLTRFAILSATYLGTAAGGGGMGMGVSADAAGNIYVTGSTLAATGPNSDFIMKLNAACTSVLYTKHFGGTPTLSSGSLSAVSGRPGAITADSAGNAYVTYTVTGRPWAITVDSAGNAYVTGRTDNKDFSVVNPIQATIGSGNSSAYVVQLNSSGTMTFATFLGGNNQETGYGIALDPAGNIWVAGSAGSGDLPVTSGAVKRWSSGIDTFVAKIGSQSGLTEPPNPLPAITSISPTAVCAGLGAITVTVNGSNFTPLSIVRLKGYGRPTKFVSSSQLTVLAYSQFEDNIDITVFNPAPGGGISNSQTLVFQWMYSAVAPACASTTPNPVPQITSLDPPSVAAGGNALDVTVTGSGFVRGVVVRWNGSDRTTTFISDKQLSFRLLPADIAATGTVQVTVFSPSPGGGTSAPATFTIASAPVVPPGGLVHSAYNAVATAAAIGSLYGINFSSGVCLADVLPLPTVLCGARVKVDSYAAGLFFVSPGQINFQIPWEVAGRTSVNVSVIIDAVQSPPMSMTLKAYSPGIYTANATGTGQGAVLNAVTGEWAAPVNSISGVTCRPVTRGTDWVVIYATGLGPVTNPPASGAVAKADPLSTTTSPVTVSFGGVAVQAAFAGLTPGLVSLYQVNAQVPATSPTGNAVPLTISIAGATSNTVTLAVQ
jgi:uncharacterized protein (TIGR03437 family)